MIYRQINGRVRITGIFTFLTQVTRRWHSWSAVGVGVADPDKSWPQGWQEKTLLQKIAKNEKKHVQGFFI